MEGGSSILIDIDPVLQNLVRRGFPFRAHDVVEALSSVFEVETDPSCGNNWHVFTQSNNLGKLPEGVHLQQVAQKPKLLQAFVETALSASPATSPSAIIVSGEIAVLGFCEGMSETLHCSFAAPLLD